MKSFLLKKMFIAYLRKNPIRNKDNLKIVNGPISGKKFLNRDD